MDNNTEAQVDSTQQDDSQANVGRTEDQLLADIVKSSPFTQSLPEEQVPELDPEESDLETQESEEPVSEEVEEEVQEESEEAPVEDAAEEAATQETEVYSQDDLDLDAKISVKIDDRLPVIPVRAIENSATQNFISEQKKLINLVEKKEISLKDAQLSIEHFWAGSLKKAVIDGDVESGSLMAGQSVSLVKKLQSVSEIFNELTQQMKSQINFEQKDSNNG